LYACPSRRPAEAKVAPASDDYGQYNGAGWAWGKTDYAGNTYVIPNRPKTVRILAISDGTAHTVLVGEKAMNPLNYSTGTWYWDEPFFTGGSGGTQRGKGFLAGQGTVVIRDSKEMGLKFLYNWGSAHPAGAQFLFGDGSVRILEYGISSVSMLGLLTPNGGDAVGDF
jgi:prepilin-type processing-associated H-X9-DG protein